MAPAKPPEGWPKDRVKRVFLEKGEDAARKLAIELDCNKSAMKRWFEKEWVGEAAKPPEKPPRTSTARETTKRDLSPPPATKPVTRRRGGSNIGRRVIIHARAGMGAYTGQEGTFTEKTNDSAWPFRITMDDGVVLSLDEWQFDYVERG